MSESYVSECFCNSNVGSGDLSMRSDRENAIRERMSFSILQFMDAGGSGADGALGTPKWILGCEPQSNNISSIVEPIT